ncbi:MAG: hydrogenase maturation nickel metallochaperone HypA [Leptolyngbyaceae bacterium]|nr:hydrogenase maturation nickel metallochaperone HypA [Leptolyngbyaceae bacterium]
MTSMNLLAVFNPLDYWRSGYVTVPWQAIAQQFQISPEALVLSDLRDLSHTPLPVQVDRIDPEDPSRDTLVFALTEPIPPGTEDRVASALVRVDSGKLLPHGPGEPCLEVIYSPEGQEQGVRLSNNRLIAWFNLVPDPENGQRNWFAGAATSVQLDHQELLDPFRAAQGEWLGQDPEKRCIQIAELQLPGPPHPIKAPYHPVYLPNHPYRLVSQSEGPVRAGITIASAPFDYMGPDPATGQNRHLVCELYRVIHLYAGADYLVEELFVKGKPKAPEDILVGPEVVNLSFAAHYFSHLHLGDQPTLYQPPHVLGWFAFGSPTPPYPGYGFATDLHVDAVHYPYQGQENHFGWELLPGKAATCLHLFMRGQPEGFDSQTGRLWYETIYQPLKAEIYEETPIAATQSVQVPWASDRPLVDETLQEVRLMKSVLNNAIERAKQEGAQHIYAIEMRVGEASGVEPESLQQAFDTVKQGTMAEMAHLEVDAVPTLCHCIHCNLDFQPVDILCQCPQCHQSAEIIQGKEFELASLAVS